MAIWHSVVSVLKVEMDAEQRAELLARYQKLGEECGGHAVGILQWIVGENLDTRKGRGFSEIAVFVDTAALEAFAAHPKHAEFGRGFREIADWLVGTFEAPWPPAVAADPFLSVRELSFSTTQVKIGSDNLRAILLAQMGFAFAPPPDGGYDWRARLPPGWTSDKDGYLLDEKDRRRIRVDRTRKKFPDEPGYFFEWVVLPSTANAKHPLEGW